MKAKFEVRFEARVGRTIKMWSRKVSFIDDAEGFDAFKGFDALKIEVVYCGKIIDRYCRDNGRR